MNETQKPPTPRAAGGAPPDKRPPRAGREAAEHKAAALHYAEALLVAAAAALLIRTFAVQAIRIPSGSMKPTLLVGDFVIVEKATGRLRAPARFDVVVFKYPHQDNEMTAAKWLREFYELVVLRRHVPRRDYVKRVIGVPGDVVLGKGGRVYVNGRRLREPYVRSVRDEEFGPFKVPADAYFVLGDNRDDSRDSRHWGFVPRKLVKGRAAWIYWSWIPAACPKHRSAVEKLRPDLRPLDARGLPPPSRAYVCDAGGEVLLDDEDVRLTKWYEFWRHVRWNRLFMAVG